MAAGQDPQIPQSQEPTLSPDPTDPLTLREAAGLLSRHPQTVRRYIREGKLAATPTQGRYGEEYRIGRSSLEDLAQTLGVSIGEPEPAMTYAHSRLDELAEMLRGVLEGQKALLPSEEEAQERADRDKWIAEALAGNTARVEELARENERLRTERDRARAEREKLKEALARERSLSWWERMWRR